MVKRWFLLRDTTKRRLAVIRRSDPFQNIEEIDKKKKLEEIKIPSLLLKYPKNDELQYMRTMKERP